jgi:uncharacterized protein YlxW (UPF0749 family)
VSDTGAGQPRRGARRSAWSVLRDGVRPRASRGQLLAALLLGMLGFALVVQLRSTDEVNLATLRQSDLVRILDDVTERSDRLRAEAAELEQTRDELMTSSDRIEAAREQAQKRVDVLGILTGTAPAVGPGIVLTVIGGEADARLVVDTVQELRDAGAEAIELNDVRVVASTSFVDAPERGIEVDGTHVEQPFVFTAIGDPQTLATAMSFPDGVVEKVEQRGGTARVQQLEEVRIDSLRSLTEPEYARPADPATPTSTPTP